MRFTPDGTNPNAWVHPWERDTTRGAPNLDQCPSMHSSEVKATMKVAVCQCCGVNFGYEISIATAPAYCTAHRWLAEKKRLGIPLLNGLIYNDSKTGLEVTGRNIRWSYCFMEDDPKVRQLLFDVLEHYFKIVQQEEQVHWLPRVIKTSRAVMVMDLQRWHSQFPKDAGSSTGGVDVPSLSYVFDILDEVYVEAL